MKVEGSYQFKSPRQAVWDAFLAPGVLAQCIPGCQSLEPESQDTFNIVMKVGVAAISDTYTGKVSISDKSPLQSYRMLVQGKGSSGSVKGEGLIQFSDTDDGTEVHISGDAQVTGIVARVGQRLMGGTSKLLLNQFTNCIKSKLEG